MKAALVFSIIIVLGLQSQIECGIAIEKHDPNKDCSSHCCGSVLGAMDKGETKRIEGVCEIAVCMENRDIKITSCAPIVVEFPCYAAKGDLSKPFPKCCFEIECFKDTIPFRGNYTKNDD